MIKKLFTVTVCTVLALSACGGGAATPETTTTATEAEVATALISITEAPATSEPAMTPSETATSGTPATITATAGTPIPTNPADCTNKASFVADVTIPDNTNIGGGTNFTKTWRIANTGTCVWGPNYTVSYYSGERLNAVDSLPLSLTYPGQNIDISMELTAPNRTGTFQGNYVIKNPAGLIMSINDDSRLWVIINVTVLGAASSATSTATLTLTPAATSASTATSGSVTPTVTGTLASPTSGSTTYSTATCAFTTDRAKLTEVINAVNAYRAQKGLPAYTVNAQLAQAAQRHAIDIACHKLYVHTGTDGSTPKTRVADTGYVASSVSENVNGNYPPLDGKEAVNWWINDKTDPRHGQNLVSTTFTEIGVGYAFFDNYGFYALVFAKP
jgi:uncharacterized protein YkwD